MEGAGLRVPWSTIVESVGEAERGARRRASSSCRRSCARRSRWAARAAASRNTETELAQVVSEGLAASPINQVLVEESVLGWGEFELEVMRDRNDNVVDHLLDRERRPDGRPHRRLGHGRAGADAHRRASTRSSATRRSRVIRAVGVETGGSNVQFAVNPETRRDRRDRDEPARLALLGARLEGDRLPDREDRREARRRLRARGDPQRHHRGDAGLVRADDRLRRHQDPALRVREVPRRRGRR